MKEHLDLFLVGFSRIFDEKIYPFAWFIMSFPFLLGLLGPIIEKFEQGKPQKLTREFFKKISKLLILFRRRKLRPAKRYFTERLATIRTLF